MQRHGWTLLFHDCLVEQLDRLGAAWSNQKSNR